VQEYVAPRLNERFAKMLLDIPLEAAEEVAGNSQSCVRRSVAKNECESLC